MLVTLRPSKTNQEYKPKSGGTNVLCFFPESIFASVPAVMQQRKGAEMRRDLEAYGLQVGQVFDAVGGFIPFRLELSRSSPQRFLEACNIFGVVRCDVDRASDFAVFLGRSPLTLAVVAEFEVNPDLRAHLTALQPDELFEKLNDVAADILSASNTAVENLEPNTRGIVTEQVGKVLDAAGFGTPDNRESLDPAPRKELTDADRGQLRNGWDADLYGSPDSRPDPFETPANWNGF